MPTSARWGLRLIELVRRAHRLVLAIGLLAVSSRVSLAETFDNQLPSELSGMGVTERLSDTVPLDIEFRDEGGNIVKLGQFFTRGKPVILSFNYSNCPMLCSLQLSGLVTGLQDVELTCGSDYEFVSISIDPRELPQRAAQTRQRYYQMYGRQGTGNGWHFLVGSQASIDRVAKAVGVTYRYLPARKEYLHPAVCAIATPNGQLSRYLYGVAFDPQTIRLSLVEASEGKIGTTLDQLLLFCFHYDSATGKYSIAARQVMTLGGLLTVFVMVAFLLRQFRRESKLHKLSPVQPVSPQIPPATPAAI